MWVALLLVAATLSVIGWKVVHLQVAGAAARRKRDPNAMLDVAAKTVNLASWIVILGAVVGIGSSVLLPRPGSQQPIAPTTGLSGTEICRHDQSFPDACPQSELPSSTPRLPSAAPSRPKAVDGSGQAPESGKSSPQDPSY